MSTPEFKPGYEVQDQSGHWYQVIGEVNDYSIRAWDYTENRAVTIEKRFFATY